MDRTRASAAAVARELNVSDVAVHKAATAGRISRNTDKTFDIDKVKLEWAANTSPTRGGSRKPGASTPAYAAPAFDSPANNAAQDNAKVSGSLLKARTMRESYEAQSAKLKYQEQVGLLINRAGAERAADTAIRTLRDAAINAVDQLALDHATKVSVRAAIRTAIADAFKAVPPLSRHSVNQEQAA